MLVFRFVQVDNRKGYIPDPLDITFGGVLNCWWVCSLESHKFPFNWTLEDTPTTYPTHPYTLDRLSHRGWWEFETLGAASHSMLPHQKPDLTPKIMRMKKTKSLEHKNYLLNNLSSSFFRFHIKFRVGRQRLRLEIFHPLLCAHWNYGPKLQGLRVQPSIFVKHSNIGTSPLRSISLF